MILTFKERLKEYKLNKKLLNVLKEEEDLLYKISEQRVIIKSKTTDNSTFYFKSKDKYYAVDFPASSY